MKVLQWTFAAVPGHPVLRDVCEHIKRHADKLFSEDEHYDVLERTGPGPWTDAIVNHAHLYKSSQVCILWADITEPTIAGMYQCVGIPIVCLAGVGITMYSF